MEVFKGETINYPAYSRRWVPTSFITQDRLCYAIFLGFNAIIFTCQSDLGIRI